MRAADNFPDEWCRQINIGGPTATAIATSSRRAGLPRTERQVIGPNRLLEQDAQFADGVRLCY
jgi:hypothetical protein